MTSEHERIAREWLNTVASELDPRGDHMWAGVIDQADVVTLIAQAEARGMERAAQVIDKIVNKLPADNVTAMTMRRIFNGHALAIRTEAAKLKENEG